LQVPLSFPLFHACMLLLTCTCLPVCLKPMILSWL
jgi:hypothetical protein